MRMILRLVTIPVLALGLGACAATVAPVLASAPALDKGTCPEVSRLFYGYTADLQDAWLNRPSDAAFGVYAKTALDQFEVAEGVAIQGCRALR